MRFRPAGGISTPKATQARLEAAEPKTANEEVFDTGRHTREIEQAENIAAGLPPEAPAIPAEAAAPEYKKDFREPDLEKPETVNEEEESFTPVTVPDQPPEGIVETIRVAATKIVRKVQRLIKPVKRVHKEVVINAESLEIRVAVLEDGRLEEFTIERTSDERLVGSIFKGKVKNLEDGLKAAFVDIGFEKNAFLHYWDIVPAPFDSGVEVVEREGRRREKPRITQKDIPRLYPPGSEIIVQVT